MIHNSKGKLLLWLTVLVVLLGVLPVLVAHADPDDAGTIIIEKQTRPAGGTGFEFTHNIPDDSATFHLDDNGQKTFLQVPVDIYKVKETDPAVTPGDYPLTSVKCEGDGWTSEDVATRTATIDLHPGETVKCTFTNRRIPVGGIVVPVNKLGLLVPWLGLAALASLSALTIALVSRGRG